MSILKDFYKITDMPAESGSEATYKIQIQKEHPIFDGHFPENPVTPGVCMLQIIKELSEQHTGSKLFLAKAKNIKFMSIINPEIQPDIKIDLNFDTENTEILNVKSTFSFEDPQSGEEIIALKFSGSFKGAH